MELANTISLFNKPECGGKIIKKMSEDGNQVKIYNNRRYLRIKKNNL